MDEISLQNILDGFNAPLNEEQAWAVCFQCANYLQTCWDEFDSSTSKPCFTFSGLDLLYLGKDGNISKIAHTNGSQPAKIQSELIQCIGVLIYQALDFGLCKNEEHTLSPGLEHLIDAMTESLHEGGSDEEQDEGIEDEEDHVAGGGITLQDVMQLCSDHLPSQSNPSSHYKAVCRALVTESIELTTFLEVVTNKSKLKAAHVEEQQESEEIQLEQLQRADWARLWMQVMHDLRSGKSLRKVEVCTEYHHSHHQGYELTPYEALMKDIKDKKYQLKQVMVNGDIPPRTQKDAHDIILDFIRQRPPLHPVRERKCQRPVEPKQLDPIEKLLESIRSEPSLRKTPSGSRLVETSRTKLDSEDAEPLPTKKVIAPPEAINFSLGDFSDDEENTSSDEVSSEEEELQARNKVEAEPFSPITPLSPSCNPGPIMTPPSQWQSADDSLLALKSKVPLPSIPAHIRRKIMKGAGSMERLSLTLEEVKHIRNVLTKAELESLLVKPDLHDLVAKGKVCFTCLKTKFSLFGAWSTKCKMCQRCVCSKCVSKMNIPAQHFESIPVYTLSPSHMKSSRSKEDIIYDQTGSVPNSPERARKTANMSKEKEQDSLSIDGKFRRKVARSSTLRQSPSTRPTAVNIKGTEMELCRDCKAMILDIIKSSRVSTGASTLLNVLGMNSGGSSPARTLSPASPASPMSSPGNGNFVRGGVGRFSLDPSRMPQRNFRLDLKPVYKAM